MKEQLERIITTDQAAKLNDNLSRVSVNLYKQSTSNSVSENVFIGVDQDIVSFIKEILGITDSSSGKLSVEKLGKEIKDVIYELKGKKTLDINLFFEPTPEYIIKLHNYFVKLYGKDFLLNIKVDRSILGGLIFSWEGNFFDLSLKSKLDRYFEKNKDVLLSRLQK